MLKFRTSKQFPPYDKDGNCNLKTNSGGGVYIIREKYPFNNRVVYVGKSHESLKKTLYRHFQQWNDKRSATGKKWQIFERVTYHGQPIYKFSVQICFVNDKAAIDALEQALIFKFKPRDNKQKLNFYTEAEMDKIERKFESATGWNPANDFEPF